MLVGEGGGATHPTFQGEGGGGWVSVTPTHPCFKGGFDPNATRLSQTNIDLF